MIASPLEGNVEYERFLAALELPFSSPVDRALKIAEFMDSDAIRAVFLPRVLDMQGSIKAHWQSLDVPGINPRIVLESLIQMIEREASSTVDEVREIRDEWWRRFGLPRIGLMQPHLNDRDPERPLKVGYVSANFKHSSAGNCLEGIVLQHSDRVIPICYSTNPAAYDDPISWTFQAMCRFVDISTMTETQFAEQVRADRVDILIDCMGFTRGNRLGTFAQRVAPIQLTGWGYATGTIPTMDGILLDRMTAGADRFYEDVVELPCVITYHPPAMFAPDVQPQPTGQVTFGAFHCFVKINPGVLALWKQVLDRVPGSRIVFKGKEYGELMLRQRITDVLGADRCEFWPQTLQLEHLDAFKHVDLVLDPFPQTGGITTCEALYMGVPSVTLLGERTIQRAAGSILTLAGFPEGVTTSEAAYVDRAVELVTVKRDWLAAQRPLWRSRLLASPICAGYTSAAEAVFRSLWRDWCAAEECVA